MALTVDKLKKEIGKYNMINHLSKLKKDKLLEIYNAILKYEEQKKDYNYWKYIFNGKEITVNEEQYNVITSHQNDNIRIVACAGSGKTTTIICRIKYLIDHGVKPEKIILTTFNVDASKNMKKKLRELFGFMPRIKVGNIDSIASSFYHKYFNSGNLISVSEYSNELLKFLQTNNGSIITSAYDYFFFDEFQDTNEVQYNIVNEFYKAGCRITVIGDDAQNIYQFRGSNVKFIVDLDKFFATLITHKLSTNYRSTPEIIDLANSSIIHNRNQIPKKMIASNPSINIKPHVNFYYSPKTEYLSIVKKVKELALNKVDMGNIAILSRNNYPLKKIEELVEKEKMAYVSLITNEKDSSIKAKLKEGHLAITTIHKSKGLEWDIVFLIGCDDSTFPSEKTLKSLEEERRLFYVAVTRPRKELYISFHKREGKPVYITRFLQEVPHNLYVFPNHDSKYYKLSTYSTDVWETGVSKLIQMLNETDIGKMRELGIIPNMCPITNKIHNEYRFSRKVKSNNWEADYGEFIDRYMTRLIGLADKETNGLEDRDAECVIYPCILDRETFIIYKRYKKNFKYNIGKINADTPHILYHRILNQIPKNSIMNTIEGAHYLAIRKIVQKMLQINKNHFIDMNRIYVTNEEGIPKEFIGEMTNAYNMYRNQNKKNEDITSAIYRISMCRMICTSRRRLLYNEEACNDFISENKEIFDNMTDYINDVISDSDNLLCKKSLLSKKYTICGEMDLWDKTNSKIIDYKCSDSDNFQLEWLIQLLAYASILKEETGIDTNILEIYNPLRGIMFVFNISDWQKHNELLEYLAMVRERQANRNKEDINEIDNGSVKETFMEYSNKIINDCNNAINQNNIVRVMERNEKLIKAMINSLNSDKMNVDKKNEILGLLKRYYDRNKRNNDTELLYRLSKLFDYKYMVLDTETSGLPILAGFQSYPPYTMLSKYDTARVIQLSWAIYDNNDVLLKTEDHLIKPHGFYISKASMKVHGITMEKAKKDGIDINIALNKFMDDLKTVDYVVCHNALFDTNVVKSELFRLKRISDIISFDKTKSICTLEYVKRTLKEEKLVKNSKLGTVYEYFYNEPIGNAHNALYDVLNTGKVLHKLREHGLFLV